MCSEQCGRSVVGTDNWRCRAMQTRRFIPWALAAVMTTSAIALSACGGAGSDKAGGEDKPEPRVLTMAVQSGVPDQMSAFAEEVSRLSDGTLEVAFEQQWRLGEPRYEAGTLEDVRAAKVDMAWVGARVFDTIGVQSFRALLAPLLVDSYDLEAKVFEEGIPAEMLKAVDELDLVGVGVLPGPMRKVLGVSRPFLGPGDFAGHVVGIQASTVAEKTLAALGATPKPVPAEAPLDGLDAYEQQLASIAGNSYDATAKYVTSNVNLWPRPLVIVMGTEAFQSLTDEQQSALRDAAESAIPMALEASRAEDEEAVATLCRRGMTLATASESDLAELRAAFEPVYADLTSDQGTRSYIDAITRLKSGVAAQAEAPGCASASDSVRSARGGIPEGTYEVTVTRDDYARWGVEVENTGVFTLELRDGRVILRDPAGGVGFDAPYTVFRDRLEAVGDPDTLTARWEIDGRRLEFKEFRVCTGSPCVPLGEFNYHVVWASHPWVRAESRRTPIDGVYEFTTTREDFVRAGSPDGDIVLENYGEHRWVLDDGRFEMTQKNGASDRWTEGTYVVRGNTVVFTVENFGGVAPNNASEKTGEVFTYTWNLYRDTLTLGPVEGAISPENFRAKPWTRAD
jgi:TRAP-type C4-dicarboxylate transport system substrate-binding protein